MSLGNGGFAVNDTPQVSLPIGQQASTSGGLPPGVPSSPYQFKTTDTMRGNMHGGGGFYQMPPAGSGQPGSGFSAGTPSWASGLIGGGQGAPSPSPVGSYIPPTMIGADSSRNTFGGMDLPGSGAAGDGGPVKEWLGQLNKYYYDQAKTAAPNMSHLHLPGGVGQLTGEYDPTENYEDLYRSAQMAQRQQSLPEQELRYESQIWNRATPEWQRQYLNAGDEKRKRMLLSGDQEISGA